MDKEHDLKSKFIKKWIINPETGCWDWIAYCDKDGYGKIYLRKKSEKAHRIAWILYKGEIPDGMCICHTCDNRQCVNPDHLFLASHQENMADMKNKNRSHMCSHPGDSNPNAQLRNEEVQEIRKIWKSTVHYSGLIRKMSKLYRISESSLGDIVNYRTWNNI